MTETITFYSDCFLRKSPVLLLFLRSLFKSGLGMTQAEHILWSPSSCIPVLVRFFDFVCLLTWPKLELSGKSWNWETSLSDCLWVVCGTFPWLVIDMRGSTVGSATHGSLVLADWEPGEPAQKQHSFLAPASAPASTFLPWVASLAFLNRLRMQSQTNPFLSKLLPVLLSYHSNRNVTKSSPTWLALADVPLPSATLVHKEGYQLGREERSLLSCPLRTVIIVIRSNSSM